MKTETLRELEAVLAPDRISSSPEELIAYSYDGYAEGLPPDLVVFPVTTEEVSAVMRIAHREGIPVTPRGSGTNVAGESVAKRGGIVMCLTKMDKILGIDPRSLNATLQPGVIPADLGRAVDKFGLMYPPDPSTVAVATIGGTVATNAGGPRTLKYGVTKDYLLGLKAVLADGSVLKTGGRTLKNVTGYNLTNLLCGSEGTLGVITEITVKLIPKPPASRTLRADFASLDKCSTAVAEIMASGILPAALEFMDQFVIRAVEQSFNMGLPTDVEALLLVQVDGNPETLDREVEHITRVLTDAGAGNIEVAKDAKEAEQLWMARRASGPAVFKMRPNVITEDITVPAAQFSSMVRKAMQICEGHRVSVGIVAHAGDGNLHPSIVFDRRDADEYARVKEAMADLAREALKSGGTLSGEHGIGIAKAPFLPLEMDPTALRVMQQIKRSFDPKGILNPGTFVEA